MVTDAVGGFEVAVLTGRVALVDESGDLLLVRSGCSACLPGACIKDPEYRVHRGERIPHSASIAGREYFLLDRDIDLFDESEQRCKRRRDVEIGAIA